MVVTSSLARGLVRETIVRQSVRCDAAWARLRESGLRAPGSLRGFREWFRKHERIFGGRAVLIVYGFVGRRRGAFNAYMPTFCEDDRGWILMIERLQVEFEPARIVRIDCDRLPLSICGHALERMFQRGDTLEWGDVRDALADALVFFSAAHRAYSKGSYPQSPLPVSGGLLMGRFVDGAIQVKTFLPEGTLNARHAALLAGFRTLLCKSPEAFHLAAACGGDAAVNQLGALLAAREHRWLREPYVPVKDRFEAAWVDREEELVHAG